MEVTIPTSLKSELVHFTHGNNAWNVIIVVHSYTDFNYWTSIYISPTLVFYVPDHDILVDKYRDNCNSGIVIQR